MSAVTNRCAEQRRPLGRGKGKGSVLGVLRVPDFRATGDPSCFDAIATVWAVTAFEPFRFHEARPSKRSNDCEVGSAEASAVDTAASNRGWEDASAMTVPDA